MAWVRRNCRQLVSVCRNGAGGICGALQDPPDRRGADAVAELEQLALDPLVAPARVLPRHPHDQGGEDVVDRWPSGPVRVGPLRRRGGDASAGSCRGDQAMQRSLGAGPGRGRRTRPGPPSPGGVVGWCGAARRPRGAARGARRPWRRTCGRAGPASRRAGRRSGRAGGATRLIIMPYAGRSSLQLTGQADFWHPTRFRHHFSHTWLDRGGPEGDLMGSTDGPHRRCCAATAPVPAALGPGAPTTASSATCHNRQVCSSHLVARFEDPTRPHYGTHK